MNDPITVTTGPAAPERARLVLRGRLTVAHAAEFRRTALALLGETGGVVIDCAAVEYLDVAVVQVLVCLEREPGRAGRRAELVGVPPALAADLRLMGLARPPAPAGRPREPVPADSKWARALRAVAAFDEQTPRP